MANQLLAQIIYILFPLLFYITLIKNKPILKKHKSIIIGFFCSIAIYLCMTNPISFAIGSIMDLRTIPWIVSFLYGGFQVGIIVTGLMFVFLIFLGGAGMYVVFIAYSISTVLLYIYFKNYSNFPYQKKLKTILSLTVVNAILVVLSFQLIFKFNLQDIIFFYFFFIILHLVAMWFTFYIIEILYENERLQLELPKSEKLKVIGQMAASIAHEIRNPMTTVHGFLQLLSLDSSMANKQHKEKFEIMIQELNRAEKIISDYLTLAKPVVEKIEKLDLKHLVERIEHSLSSYATLKGVSIEYAFLENEEYILEGNAEKIQQVLVNIIKNAVEVSPSGSVVNVSIVKGNKNIEISIKDTGCGMSNEEVENLGIPFYSLKENGTGLGLTICYSIVNSMGGRIDVKSERNIGTTFIISLPRYTESLS